MPKTIEFRNRIYFVHHRTWTRRRLDEMDDAVLQISSNTDRLIQPRLLWCTQLALWRGGFWGKKLEKDPDQLKHCMQVLSKGRLFENTGYTSADQIWPLYMRNRIKTVHNVHIVDFDSPVSKIAPVSATGLYNVALKI